MDGASENRVTGGHVTFREASSTIFWYQTPARKDFSPLFRVTRALQIFRCESFFLTPEEMSTFNRMPCSTYKSVEQLLYIFYTLGQYVMFINYVYDACQVS